MYDGIMSIKTLSYVRVLHDLQSSFVLHYKGIPNIYFFWEYLHDKGYDNFLFITGRIELVGDKIVNEKSLEGNARTIAWNVSSLKSGKEVAYS